MRRALMVSPHFPPDTSAAAHRVRLLAPYLRTFGWTPTVVTVDPRDYEGRLDTDLLGLVPDDLHVVRCRAWPARATRRLGIGDLGLRAFRGLFAACRRELAARDVDVLFITTYPVYPALLGPILKSMYRVPFVVDYQDPWVGAWGRVVGGGPNGTPDLKSRCSRAAIGRLEPIVARSADAITAVSAATYEQVLTRSPAVAARRCAEIPLGFDVRDFERVRERGRRNRYFDSGDGNVHICYVGTVLPMGSIILDAILSAVALLRRRRPDLYARLRLHFIGSSNQTSERAPLRVVPLANEHGVGDRVSEIAPRVDYLDALAVLAEATAILLLGSSEPHYTPSKVYPALLTGRPMVAVYHRSSTVVDLLRRVAPPPAARVIVHDDVASIPSKVEEILSALIATIETAEGQRASVDTAALERFSAPSLASALADIFDHVAMARWTELATSERR